MIDDKEILVEELEEHLKQVREVTLKNPFTDINEECVIYKFCDWEDGYLENTKITNKQIQIHGTFLEEFMDFYKNVLTL
jgi:hypothetical protein